MYVDVDFVDVGREVVADIAHHQIVFAVHQCGGAHARRCLLDGFPQAQQVGEVTLQLARAFVEAGGGAHDDAEALGGAQLLHQLADAEPVGAFDSLRDPRLVRARQEHQVAPRQRVEGAERRRLAPELLLDDLHEDFLSGFQHLLDAWAPASFAVVARAGAVGQIAKADFIQRQERIALRPDVDEGRFQGGMDAVHDPLVDVALQMLATEGFDFERRQDAVGDDSHATLFGVGHVDQHDFGHTLFPPLIRHRRGGVRACRLLIRRGAAGVQGTGGRFVGHFLRAP